MSLVFARVTVLEATAEHQQTSVLAGVERVRHVRAGPSEAIWLVVVAGARAVARSDGARRLWRFLRLQIGHVSRCTPCSCPEATPVWF
jgi:hypothetical protein